MVEAAFGLLGVLLGGFVTWSAQAFQEWRTDEALTLGAARTLLLDLMESAGVLEDCIRTRSVNYDLESVARPTEQWERDRALVARKLAFPEVLDVYSGFRVLAVLRRMRSQHEQGPQPSLALADTEVRSLRGWREDITSAQAVLLSVSSRLERSLQRRTTAWYRHFVRALRSGRGLPAAVVVVVPGVALARIYGHGASALLIYGAGLLGGIGAAVAWVLTAPPSDDEG